MDPLSDRCARCSELTTTDSPFVRRSLLLCRFTRLRFLSLLRKPIASARFFFVSVRFRNQARGRDAALALSAGIG